MTQATPQSDETAALLETVRSLRQALQQQATQLQAASSRFARLLDTLPQAAWVIDSDGAVRQGNAAARRWLPDLHAGSVPPQLEDLFEPPSRDAVASLRQQALREGHAQGAGLLARQGGDAAQAVQLQLLPLVAPAEPAEAPAQFLAVALDATPVSQLQHELLNAHRLLEAQPRENRWLSTVVRSAQAMVVFTDAKRRVIWVNAAFTRVSGYTAPEVIGRGLGMLQGPGTDPATLAVIRAHLHRGQGFSNVELLNFNKAGLPYWVSLDVQPMTDADGALEGYVSVQLPVTDRRQAKRNAEDAQRRMDEAQARQRAIFDAAPILLCVVGLDGRLEDLNTHARELLGADARGQLLANYLHPDDEGQLGRLMRRAREGEIGLGRCVLKLPDGSRRTFSAQVGPIRHGDKLAQLILAARDITLEETLAGAREEAVSARAANEAKSRFLARMSHELRTPLNSLMGFTQLIRSDLAQHPDGNSRTLQRLDQIELDGSHLLSKIEATLALSRIDAGGLRAVPEAVPLAPLLRDAWARRGGEASARSLQFTLNLHAPNAEAWADAQRLAQVLEILLKHVVQPLSDGARVVVGTETHEQGIAIVLQGHPEGDDVPPVPTAFEPMKLVGPASFMGDVALDLTLAKELCQLMQGQLEVPAEAKPCAFRLSLPVPFAATQAPAAQPSPRDAPKPGDAQHPPGPVRVLYVEDVDSNVELLRQILDGSPWELLVTTNGTDGLALAQRERPDLILLDLNLPDLDGVEVRRRLLAHPATARIPCAALTADVVGRQETAADVPFDAWIAKPLRIKLLRATMRQLVSHAP